MSGGNYGSTPTQLSYTSKDHAGIPSVVSKLLPKGPIFLENPDGSIAEAIPSHLADEKLKKPRSSSRPRDGSESDEGSVDSRSSAEIAAATMAQEVELLYSRHERVFCLVLFAQFIIEVLYCSVFVIRMRPSVIEFVAMYGWEISTGTAELVLWIAFSMQVSFALVYFSLAILAIWTKGPKDYRIFASCSLIGVCALVLLAYVDKFNLPIFFLRILAYIYARFLQGLTASLVLLPPVRPPRRPTQVI